MDSNFHIDNEKIYEEVFNILAELAVEPWDYLQVSGAILNKNLSEVMTIQGSSEGRIEDIPIGWKIFDIQDLVIHLRKMFLESTGQRIWGFKFDFFKSGKFTAQFDYEKPINFDEEDDFIN
ncbi:hypothetical protein [Herbaspirillum huttiense]|uniref:DUF600 family protein n=2 Tax=Herbaspirillum huttiense TaxID=863372 RepID=A0AAJ2HJD3_9BURK|nr:hypothetical protein [Herbaspirillum huttiense]MDR9839865.1 hypothetical protein [Herbaspirillum huttiense]